jgi:hypothetical protein
VITDRIKLVGAAALCAVFLSTTIWLFFAEANVKRDRDRLDAEIETPITGFRDRLATCQAQSRNLEGAITFQSEQVAAWKAEADRIKAEGAQATKAAQDRARSFERQLVGARRAQPKPGETICEAADRTIMERVG